MECSPDEIQELFVKLIRFSPAERPALLDRYSGENQPLRRRVAALLEAHDRADSYLDQPNAFLQSKIGLAPPADVDATGQHIPAADSNEISAVVGGSATVDFRNDAVAGIVIAGRYTLQTKIGEGGMGEVWVAKQSQPIKRSVAIKLIKAGMDSKAVVARFEQERQALALMDHPNIARVLDGGLTPTGQPFFVMELVKGFPITEYCDRMKLPLEKRLELFIPVCQAIQHAHQKGIIHRDIKPSNVLVALYDDLPVPKVIDFGIAKATGGALTEHTISTGFGGVIGTPQYMSPEQATLNNLDVDTRSDVYSLGVLLYELLTGSPPFSQQELEQRGVLEILRVVREDEPPRPSVKLSSSDLLPSLSANRGMEPSKLAKLLRSELDWIVLKALEKQRTRRYESASGFAADVSRYLAGDRVLAHPPSLSYQLRKVIHRNRRLLVAMGLIAGAMMLGLASTTWQMFRADAEANRANLEADRANQEALGAELARDAAESTLVASYFRPIGYNKQAVDPAELEVFKEIAELDNNRLKLLVISAGLKDGPVAKRVALRADNLVQAVVGLSLKRREQALTLCREKLSLSNLDPQILAASLVLVQALGDESMSEPTKEVGKQSSIDAITSALAEGDRNTNLPNASDAASRRLFAAVERLDPASVETNFDQLITPLKQVEAGNELLGIYYAKKLWERLPSSAAPQQSKLMVEISRLVANSEDRDFSESLAQFLGTYRLMLTGKMDFFFEASESLYQLPTRMNSQEADLVYQLLMENLGDTASGYGEFPMVGVGLAELAPRLDREAARTQLEKLATLITAAESPYVAADALQGIAGLAKVLGPEDSLRAYDLLIANVGKTNISYALHAVWNVMKERAPHLPPADAQRGFESIASDLNIFQRRNREPAKFRRRQSITWDNTVDFTTSVNADATIAAEALAALASAVDAEELPNLCRELESDVLTFNFNLVLQTAGVKTLAVFAPFLDDAAFSAQLDRILLLYQQAPNKANFIDLFGVYFDKIAARLTPAHAERLFETFIPGIGVVKNHSKLASRLDKPGARREFERLADLIVRSPSENEVADATQVLVALAVILDDDCIQKAFDILVNKNSLKASDPNCLTLLSRTNSSRIHSGCEAILGKSEVADAAAPLLAELVQRNEITYLNRISDKLFKIFDQAESQASVQAAFDALELIPRQALGPHIQVGIRKRALELVLARSYNSSFLPGLLKYVDSVPVLSNLLLDPSRIGDQPIFLARLEAIAFPESVTNHPATTVVPAESASLVIGGGGWHSGAQVSSEPPRRFRVLGDAAAWISKKHPEIDLERPFREVSTIGSESR